ncbi:MAG: hypothetical protein H7Y10_03905 [Flavobacterium sp.]|nr:hypothetical protein [Flavobacterium sp.]
MTLEEKIGQLNLATYVNEKNSINSLNDKIKRGEIGSILKSNFRLKKGSAGLNSGSEVLAQPTDIEGNKRPKGKARDRGAFEQ